MNAFGINFGTLTVTKQIDKDSTQIFKLHAKGYLKVLWMERSDETFSEIKYKNGILISSSYRYLEKSKLKKWTTVTKSDTIYRVETHNNKFVLKNVPSISNLHLYFTKPNKGGAIFNDSGGCIVTLNKINENEFELKTPDNIRTVYNYTKDKLIEFVSHLSIATVYMRLIS